MPTTGPGASPPERYARPGRGCWVVLIALAALVGCAHTPPGGLPNASSVLQSAAQSMAGVTSTAFTLKVSGNTTALPIASADGAIDRGGVATGHLGVSDVLFPFRLVKGVFYLQNPDNSWVSSPPAYDPTTLLDPSTGLPALLAGARQGRTVAEESVGGVTADRIQANVPPDIILQLTDLASGHSLLPATLWVATGTFHLVKFSVSFRVPQTDSATVVIVDLTNFNQPVHADPPPVH